MFISLAILALYASQISNEVYARPGYSRYLVRQQEEVYDMTKNDADMEHELVEQSDFDYRSPQSEQWRSPITQQSLGHRLQDVSGGTAGEGPLRLFRRIVHPTFPTRPTPATNPSVDPAVDPLNTGR